jgi:murein DD-endopeptidase MepM/ murein hydrolase activator NlpD
MLGHNTAGRRLRLILLVVLAGGAGFALVYWAGTRGASHPGMEHPTADWRIMPGLDAQGIPIYSYAAVDPAVIPALEAQQTPLAVIAEGVPPIGVYLPLTGDTQFSLPTPTFTPTIPPTITLTPTTRPTSLPSLTPTLTPEPSATPFPPPSFTPYYVTPPPSSGCAPAGWPVQGVLTQYFGYWHSGIDLGVALGTPVVATHSGEVIFAGWSTIGYGNLIILQNGPFITYYAHLSNFNVSQGQWVGRFEIIGWSGSTGHSTGPHVHYETRINDVPVDPLTFENRGYPPC